MYESLVGILKFLQFASMSQTRPAYYWKRLRASLTGLAGRAVPQCAALCWRHGAQGPELLLTTSLDTGRWILPKGWPMEGKTLAEAAAIEAWEEAGIKGDTCSEPLGHYHYIKIRRRRPSQRCKVSVFALKVSDMLDEYPEAGRRRREWMTPAQAAARVRERGLKRIILESFKIPNDT